MAFDNMLNVLKMCVNKWADAILYIAIRCHYTIIECEGGFYHKQAPEMLWKLWSKSRRIRYNPTAKFNLKPKRFWPLLYTI